MQSEEFQSGSYVKKKVLDFFAKGFICCKCLVFSHVSFFFGKHMQKLQPLFPAKTESVCFRSSTTEVLDLLENEAIRDGLGDVGNRLWPVIY